MINNKLQGEIMNQKIDILPALKGTGIPDVTQERAVPHDDTLVSAADGITAPFTSQTSPGYPPVSSSLK